MTEKQKPPIVLDYLPTGSERVGFSRMGLCSCGLTLAAITMVIVTFLIEESAKWKLPLGVYAIPFSMTLLGVLLSIGGTIQKKRKRTLAVIGLCSNLILTLPLYSLFVFARALNALGSD